MPLGPRGLLANILVFKVLSSLEILANIPGLNSSQTNPPSTEMSEPESRLRQALQAHGLPSGQDALSSVALKGEIDGGRARLNTLVSNHPAGVEPTNETLRQELSRASDRFCSGSVLVAQSHDQPAPFR